MEFLHFHTFPHLSGDVEGVSTNPADQSDQKDPGRGAGPCSCLIRSDGYSVLSNSCFRGADVLKQSLSLRDGAATGSWWFYLGQEEKPPSEALQRQMGTFPVWSSWNMISND